MRTTLVAMLALAALRAPAGHAGGAGGAVQAGLAGIAHATAVTMLRLNTDKENLKIANKSLEFVNIIKEDLRRNNDDYVAAGGGQGQGRGPAGGPRGPGRARRDRAAPAPPPPNRIPPPPGRDTNKRVSPKRDQLKFSIDTRRIFNITKNETITKPKIQNITNFRSYSHPARHYKKLRIEKIKRIIDKGKKLRELARTPVGAGATTPMAGPPPPLGLPAAAGDANVDPEMAENDLNAAPNINVAAIPAGEVAAMGLATPAPPVTPAPGPAWLPPAPGPAWLPPAPGPSWLPPAEPRPHHTLRHRAPPGSPAPDQLDMAPARGPDIQLLRFKGRLCQRNVMRVEGPLYDAHGSSVVPAYRPEQARGRPFPVTRPALLLLPRCCNCCKKSVLGCQ